MVRSTSSANSPQLGLTSIRNEREKCTRPSSAARGLRYRARITARARANERAEREEEEEEEDHAARKDTTEEVRRRVQAGGRGKSEPRTIAAVGRLTSLKSAAG